MTVPQRYYVGAAAVIFATLLPTLVAYPYLPNVVPVHWDVQGQVNSFGPKWSLFLYAPGLMTGIVLMFVALPWLSPKRFEGNAFRPAYLKILMMMIALLSYSQLLVLFSGLGLNIDASRALEGGACLLIALCGSLLGEVRRNFSLRIRTPWTLANEAVWDATHRFAAKSMVAGGVLGLIAATAGTPFWLPVAVGLTAALSPALYCIVSSRHLQRPSDPT